MITWRRHLLMLLAKNYNCAYVFVKVMYKILLVFFRTRCICQPAFYITQHLDCPRFCIEFRKKIFQLSDRNNLEHYFQAPSEVTLYAVRRHFTTAAAT